MAKAKAAGKRKSVKKKQTAPTAKNPSKSFNELEVGEWTRFIRFALHENPSVLNLDPKGEALDAGFIRILNSLRGNLGAKDRFGEALSLVFESTQPSRDNAEAIYTLLQLISYTTPSAAKSIVRRRVFQEAFSGLQFAAMDLHALALAVAGEWEVDQELASYITRFNEAPQEFRCRLLSLRLLSRKHPSDAYAFLLKIIPELEPTVRATQLFRELRGITLQRTYAGFLRWYRDHEVHLERTPKFDIFHDMLAKKLVPRETINKVTEDKYQRLFAYHIHASSLFPEEMKDLHGLRAGSSAEFDGEVRRVLEYAAEKTHATTVDPAGPTESKFLKDSIPKRDIVSNMNGRMGLLASDQSFLVTMLDIELNQARGIYAS